MKEAGVSAENDKIPYRIAEDPLPGVPVPSNGPLVIGGTLLFLALISAFAIVAHDMLGAGIKSVEQGRRNSGSPCWDAFLKSRTCAIGMPAWWW